MRRAALIAGLVLGCQPRDASLTLAPHPATCRHEPVSAVRASVLGDFPPRVVTGSTDANGPAVQVDASGARSVAVEGLSATGVAALGWTGPLPVPSGGPVPVFYGAPDSLCQVGGLRVPRAFHRATYLGHGNVLVTGGIDADGPTDTLEQYSADTDEIFRALPLYPGAAIGHSATALPDGTVLVAGGAVPGGPPGSPSARLYHADGSPEGGVLLLGGGPRALHAATALADGSVWLSGGCSRVAALAPGAAPGCAAGDVLNTSVRYDAQGNFDPGPLLPSRRYGHQALALPDGRVLLVGGMSVAADGRVVPATVAEIVDPLGAPGEKNGGEAGAAGGTAALLPAGGVIWADAALDPAAGVLLAGEAALPLAPAVARTGATLDVLPDGAALLAGGRDRGGAVVAALELYEAGGFRVLDDMLPREGQASLGLPDGSVLLLGGLDEAGAPSPLVSRFLHGLRVPDATPAPWPLSANEGPLWLAPRRGDRVHFDGAVLTVDGTGAAPLGRPDELALVAGVLWAGGQVRVQAAAAGAALIFAYRNDGDFFFLRLLAGQPAAVVHVQGRQIGAVAGCAGAAPDAAALARGLDVQLDLHRPDLGVSLGGAPWLRCQPALPERGALGFAGLGGEARFQGLSVVRGQ